MIPREGGFLKAFTSVMVRKKVIERAARFTMCTIDGI